MSRADKLRVKEYLSHILEAIDRINRYIGDMGEEEFLLDDRLRGGNSQF